MLFKLFHSMENKETSQLVILYKARITLIPKHNKIKTNAAIQSDAKNTWGEKYFYKWNQVNYSRTWSSWGAVHSKTAKLGKLTNTFHYIDRLKEKLFDK